MLGAAGAVLLLQACQGPQQHERPDPAFTPYITAFSAGHVSASAPILVRIADGQQWKDTSNATLQGLFELAPGVKGSVYLHDPQTVAFVPGARLESGRTYGVKLKLGSLIHVPERFNEFKFQITTFIQGIDVQVSDLRSLAADDLTWQRLLVEVRTADDALPADLVQCFSAVQDGRERRMVWEHEPNGRHHRFVVDSLKRGDAASQVLITWKGAAIGAKQDGSTSFTVPPIGELRLIHAQTNSEGEQHAVLLFSDPLDPRQDLSGIVGIAGADLVRTSVDGNRLLLHPRDRLSGSQQAFVASALRNVNGHALGTDLMVDLLFEELKPAVRLLGKGTILPSSSGLMLPFEAVNLSAVEVRVIRIHEANVAQFLQVNALDGERELARVGRQVARAVVPLRSGDAPDPGRWNLYQLDLARYFKAEPGAIYRVQIGFKRQHAIYPCPDAMPSTDLLQAETDLEDDGQWDHYEAHYWYDHDDWDYDDYDHRERENPCNASYFMGARHTVSRNLIASDLGLIAKRGNDGSMLVAVSDLRSTKPVSGVKLDVLDLQRQRMAQVVTDREGLATLPATKHKPFLLVASRESQRGYLKLDDGSSLSVSEFDVKGEAVERGLKGMIYGERGVWRPGDSLHLTFILQDAQGRLPKDHPVTLELTDPRGKLDQRHVRDKGVDGMYAFRCATHRDAPTGLWHATVRVGGTTFHKSIRIETIKPNRLKLALDLGAERIRVDEDRRATLQVNWLHGAPARNLHSRVTLTFSAGRPAFKGFEDHEFNDLRTSVAEVEHVVFEDLLDDKGNATFPIHAKAGPQAPAVLNANIVTRVFEAGGDASMDRVTVPFLPYTAYAGIKAPKSRNSWGTLVTDTTYGLPLCALDPDGKPLGGRKLKVQVYKLAYNWWWDGNFAGTGNYISSPSVQLRSEAEVVTDAKGRATHALRVDRPEWGRFAVRVTDPESGHSSALQLYFDWPGWEGRSRRQDPAQVSMLSFNADKEKYNVGESAELIIPSSGSGRVLVSLETGSRVLDATWVELKGRETRHRFTITEDMVPNVYAHVTLLQPHDSTANDLPIRLYGVVPIFAEDPATRLAPKISAPAEIRTDEPFTVEVSETQGRAMSYTLAIVDEGLLDLTRFRTPDPWSVFHAREALGVRSWDVYDHVIGAVGRRVQRILAIGGSDEGAGGDAARANRFKPVVRFVGPLKLERGGKARHTFTIDNYVGSVRMMVVAHDGARAFGNAEKAVPVRKPLMVLATLPRVLGPGETADLPVTVFAMDPKVKDVELSLEANDLLETVNGSTQKMRFDAMGDQVAVFRVRVKEGVGVARVKVTARSGKEQASEQIELQVRQPNVPITLTEEIALEPGATWKGKPQAVGVRGTNSAYLELSTIPPIDMGRRLKYLIGYPHGCVEQTTSKAFPQLYLANVIEMDARSTLEMRGNVEAAIRKLQQHLRSDGSFNYWPGGDNYDDWSSIYASHFLVEAERKGFTVPQTMRNAWTSFQRKAARERSQRMQRVPEGWDRGSLQLTQAYRLYVLALANAAELAAMNSLRNEADLGVQARWTLAAAYAIVGRADVARELTERQPTSIPRYRDMAYTYGSDLRDDALVAEALLRMGEVAKAAVVVRTIAQRLGRDEWYSTQSTAFGLMAVARLAERDPLGKGMDFKLTVAGKTEDRHSDRALLRQELPVPDGRGEVSVTNTGKSLLYARVVRTGTPLAGNERAQSSGLNMEVRYTRMDGSPIDPERIEQGTDFVAVVTLGHPGASATYRQLALTRVFPSGWEIRNVRMEGAGGPITSSPHTYEDIRDDRVMTYFDLGRGRSATYTVLLNAAYMGRYYLPGPHCEAMYDHTVNAQGAGQWVEVVKPGAVTAGK